jgi:23S rRNA (uracil1939-C5)-methyltransferase
MDDQLELVIERPVAGGRMLARHDRGVVLVAGAIPGERVRARVERATRQVTFATVTEVIERSVDRRDPPSDPSCAGLSYGHIAPARQRVLKSEIIADAFRRLGKMTLDAPVTTAASPGEGYRLRARLHVRGGRVGFFREGSHELCDAGPTGQLRQEAIAAAEAIVQDLGAAASALDAVAIAENVPATQRVLHLEPARGAAAGRVSTVPLPAGTTGVTTVKHRSLETVAGEARVSDTALDIFGDDLPVPAATTWTRSAASFFQGNRFLLGSLVRTVLDGISGDRVGDLYAGVGLFAVAAAAIGRQVLAVEGDPMASADLDLNAAPWADRLETVMGDVESVVTALNPGAFDVMIVDPPRTGMSASALASILGLAPRRLIYVSCDPATMARDAGRIVGAGYRLGPIEAFDLFPNTPHVETVALFDRSRDAG